LGDWGWQVEPVGRSLPAYASTPSTESSTPALVPERALLPGLRAGISCLFSGEASSLDAFSSYPQQRGCPACLARQLVN